MLIDYVRGASVEVRVRIIDAEPKGVYETAAIKTVPEWIYESSSRAREVKQRVEMDPADCAFDYR